MPGEWPLLDDFAEGELRAVAGANLPHTATVAQTSDSGATWSTVTGGSSVACRMFRPSPAEARVQGEELARTATAWAVAFEAGSTFAAPRLRLTITGTRAGVAFSRVLYTVGPLLPTPNEADARVLCVEDPAAVFGT